MINLVKKENFNMGILETDFDIFSDIVNTFSSDVIKKDCLVDLDDYIIPEYFRNKITLVIQTNKMLIGYVTFEFKNINNVSQVNINKLYITDDFKNNNMDTLLMEGVIYIAGEVGCRCVTVTVDEHDSVVLSRYQSVGFYEVGINEDGNLLSINVASAVFSRRLNDKFRQIPADAVDYKKLKLIKKLSSGRSGNIYLTQDGQILKMFTSTSFTYIKDREETIKYIKSLDIEEIVKPKRLVYYDGVFVGYIMEYLPEGNSLWNNVKSYSFEQKIDKLKSIEEAMRKIHEKHVFICDLNPDNIFFDNEGNVRLIDCDAFVIKENVINNDIVNKYIDPVNKIVSEKTDLYAFAVTALEILTNTNINNNATISDVEKIYNKNKNKLPVSFKDYFEKVINGKQRYYLTDSYEKYLNELYKVDDKENQESVGGNITVIILSVILLVVAMIGYLVLKIIR